MSGYFGLFNLDKKESIGQIHFSSPYVTSAGDSSDFVNAATFVLSTRWSGDRVLYCESSVWEKLRVQQFAGTSYLEGEVNAGRITEDPCGDSEYLDVSEIYMDKARSGDLETFRYVFNKSKNIYYDRAETPIEWIYAPAEFCSPELNPPKTAIYRFDALLPFLAADSTLNEWNYYGLSQRYPLGSWVGDRICGTHTPPADSMKISPPFSESSINFRCSDEDVIQLIKGVISTLGIDAMSEFFFNVEVLVKKVADAFLLERKSRSYPLQAIIGADR